jgi:hypothetical protein
MKKLLAISILALLFLPFASCCLTETERTNLRYLNVTGASPDILINLFERLCNEEYMNATLDSFRVEIDEKLNNSALINSLTQIAYIYNTSMKQDENFSLMEARINSNLENRLADISMRLDNSTYDLNTRMEEFEGEVSKTLEEKQSSVLTTNRIVWITLILVAIASYLFYAFKVKGKKEKPLVSKPMPSIREEDDDEDEDSSDKVKSRANRKAK